MAVLELFICRPVVLRSGRIQACLAQWCSISVISTFDMKCVLPPKRVGTHATGSPVRDTSLSAETLHLAPVSKYWPCLTIAQLGATLETRRPQHSPMKAPTASQVHEAKSRRRPCLGFVHHPSTSVSTASKLLTSPRYI